MTKNKSNEKPTLVLARGNSKAEDLILLYEKLTGKKMSEAGKQKYREAFPAA